MTTKFFRLITNPSRIAALHGVNHLAVEIAIAEMEGRYPEVEFWETGLVDNSARCIDLTTGGRDLGKRRALLDEVVVLAKRIAAYVPFAGCPAGAADESQ